ncbi:uncharacterized protein [Hyperolius riggenbachi]|uniref:uncharacterized protein n=1 Tax=Hyperolius riggenbachi TaxID=752182 RepID=UPI0035A32173
MAESEAQATELPATSEENTGQSLDATTQNQLPPLCRFFSKGYYCQYGRRCRFLHQRAEKKVPQKKDNLEKAPDSSEAAGLSLPQSKNPVSTKPYSEPAKRKPQNRRLCRYFASGYCSMDANCRFWHPEKLPSVSNDQSVSKKPASKDKTERPAAGPAEIKVVDATPDTNAQLRKTEISQLLKRFPKAIVQEREDGKVTYYRLTIEPTDPDWPFDLREMEIMLEFPEDYPMQVFTILMPEDQVLPSSMARYIREASEAWLQGKHATNQLIGKVELLFRPYLHWLDRNMERLFTEAARLLKRDIEAEKAGLEFVPYQQLQAAITVKSSEEVNADGDVQENDLQDSSAEDLEDDESDSWVSFDEDDDDEEEEPGTTADGMKTVEEGGSHGPRKGTEIRFLGLRLGVGVGTLIAYRIVVSLRCSRCNITADLSLTGKLPCTAQCDKCNSQISGTFYPSILHQYSTILGYVEFQGAAAKDLVLPECTFMVGCLNCSHEEPVQNLSFGVTKDMNCLKCHSKLSILAEAARFQKVERFPNKALGSKNQLLYGKKKLRDPAIRSGKPLPDQGTCRHYRKSCRWFRFPCCGKAYPCDICHDEVEDHVMELATRMLCGFCAKEQACSNGKPCIACGNMMNKNIQSVHWEGGKGCRNKVKMSRKDKQKYSNCSKTISRKSTTK